MTLTGHTHYISYLQIYQNRLISGSGDKTIKIWDIETGQCFQTLTGHTDWISCLKIYQNWLISGSDDNTIKIWNLTTGQCLQTFIGHTSSITCLKIYQNRLISGYQNGTIKIWRFLDIPYEIQEIYLDKTTYLHLLPPEIWEKEILERMSGLDWMKSEEKN